MYDFEVQCMRELCSPLTIWLLMKYLSFAGGLDSGEVQLTCNDDTDYSPGDNVGVAGHLEHVAHPPPPDLVPGPGLGARGQTALGHQPGRGAGGQNLSNGRISVNGRYCTDYYYHCQVPTSLHSLKPRRLRADLRQIKLFQIKFYDK